MSGRYPHVADAAKTGATIECPSCKAAQLDRIVNGATQLIALICPRCGAAFGPDGDVLRWRRPGLHHSR